ncbi:hypothetical protein Tco_0240859 [Tanacetum coccineum]
MMTSKLPSLIGIRLILKVPGQMTYLVASLTPDSARSYVMQGASFTQGTVSTIPFVGSISPEGFLPPILLLVVIIATVVVTVVVVVAVGGVPSILKLSFMVIGFLYRIASSIPIDWVNEFHQNKASSMSILIANFTLFFSAHLLRENTDLVCLNQRMRPTAPSVPLK